MSLQSDLPRPTTPSKMNSHPLSNSLLPAPDKSSFINIKSFLSSGLQHPFLPTLAKQSSPNIIEFFPPQSPDDFTFTSRVQDILKNSNRQTPQTSRHTPNTLFTPREPMSARLREKRLSDILIYKQRNSKGNIVLNGQEDESPKKLTKSSSSSELKRPTRSHLRQSSVNLGKKVDFSRISERRLATVVPADISSLALSTENPRMKTEETPTNIQKPSDAILSIESVSYAQQPQQQPLKLQVNTQYKPKDWKEYTEKATSPTIEREPRKLRRNMSTGSIVKPSNSLERLQTFRPLYQQFITENFKPEIVQRLDTLANFGFNTIEKDENVEVPEFLNNTSKMNPGSMSVVDLFSKKHKTRVMKTADLLTAKRTVKKFLVHCADKVKPATSRGPAVGGSFESQEGNVKSRLAAKELARQHSKHQEEELMSPMRRHLSMKKKTFYKDTQSNRERTINIISVSGKAKGKPSKLVQGIDGIMHDLDKLEEETQDDYIKVLKFSNEYETKYPPPELKATYEMRKMHNLLTTENWINKDRISEKDSEESVLI